MSLPGFEYIKSRGPTGWIGTSTDALGVETRAHVEMDLWPDVEDPATQHPMANRMIHIRQIYDKLAKDTGKPSPQIKAAS